MDFNTFLRYKGFLHTSELWSGDMVMDLEQLHLNDFEIKLNDENEFNYKRLGKLTEAFTCHQLKQNPNINWIAENVQIQNGKQTIGEIDALFQHHSETIHLEIVYKFYLYDTLQSYNDPLAYWIGPNRKDTLVYKLEKLKEKQLPLLFNSNSQPYLDNHDLKVDNINQYVSFKAQLFLPFSKSNFEVELLNNECITGFHISFNEFEKLKTNQFYIPEKLDWLVIPNLEGDWINYDETLKRLKKIVDNNCSPMIWTKSENEELKKGFITFW